MNIFISANNTDQGKTYTTLKLLENFALKGYKVAAFKPVETGVENIPQDGKKLLEASKRLNPHLKDLSVNDIVPVRLKLPAAPAAAGEVDFEKINESYKKIKPLCDVLLIEGAGGLLVPVNEKFFMADFVKYFNAKLFMVFGSRLGMINDFLLNVHFLKHRKIKYEWAVNIFDEKEYFEISHPFMKKHNPLFIQKDLDKITKKLTGD